MSTVPLVSVEDASRPHAKTATCACSARFTNPCRKYTHTQEKKEKKKDKGQRYLDVHAKLAFTFVKSFFVSVDPLTSRSPPLSREAGGSTCILQRLPLCTSTTRREGERGYSARGIQKESTRRLDRKAAKRVRLLPPAVKTKYIILYSIYIIYIKVPGRTSEAVNAHAVCGVVRCGVCVFVNYFSGGVGAATGQNTRQAPRECWETGRVRTRRPGRCIICRRRFIERTTEPSLSTTTTTKTEKTHTHTHTHVDIPKHKQKPVQHTAVQSVFFTCTPKFLYKINKI